MKNVSIRSHTLKNGQKSYEYRFEVAPINNKRTWHSKSGFKTKSEAKRAGNIALQQYENLGVVIEPSDMSFSDYLDMWINDDCKVDLKHTTISNYQKKINNHIKPVLGSYRLRTIKKEHLQAFVLDMYDKGYSQNTLSSIIGLLSKCFNYAVDHHYLVSSPAVRIRIPKNRIPKTPTRTMERVRIPTEKITEMLTQFPETHPSHIPLRLGYECGLRIGEAFALVWEDIDLENKTITVNRQVQWKQDETREAMDKLLFNGKAECGKGYWYFTNPKYDSVRVIEISDSMTDLLRREKERQGAMRAYYGENYSTYYTIRPINIGGATPTSNVFENPINSDGIGSLINLVCVRNDGTYITSRTMQHTSTVIRKRIFEKFSYHDLRHTHASMLYEEGLSEKYISERLGHSDSKITKEVYVHLGDLSRETGRATVNKLFNNAGY